MRRLAPRHWRRIACTTLLVFVVCFLGRHAHSQETQNSDLGQLKNKLEQLDEEMQELKGQIQAAEDAQRSSGRSQKPNSAAAAAPNQNQTVPKEAEEPEKKSSIDVYGFVMLDSGYDFKQENPNWFDVLRPTQLPSFKGEFAPDGNVFAGVRQSRFGVKSSAPTAFGDLNTIFEFELFGTGVDAGQTTFRLRHAYGELGPIGGGQTWSAFMDIGVFPDTIEYWGPSGMVLFRNVQMRWMPVRKKSGSVTIALERPGASGDQGVYRDRIELSNITPRFNFPDLTGNARIDRNWGYLQTAGIVRKIGWVDTSANKTNLGGSVVGWGINLTSNLNLSKNNVAKLAFVYGRGIENYMNDAPFGVGIANNPPNSKVPIKAVALPVYGVVAFLDHTWNQHFTSSAGYSMIDIVNSNAQLASDFHKGDYAIANLLYHPIPKVMMGGEFQFGRRENFRDGFNFNDYRVQISFKYDWDKSFKSPSF